MPAHGHYTLLMRLPSAPYTTFATSGLLVSSVIPCPSRPYMNGTSSPFIQ